MAAKADSGSAADANKGGQGKHGWEVGQSADYPVKRVLKDPTPNRDECHYTGDRDDGFKGPDRAPQPKVSDHASQSDY